MPPAPPVLQVIGIIGGVASGKSLAAEYLRQAGAAVLDGDRAGHEVLREPDVITAAVQRWGAGILGEDGQINRSRLADIVFAPTVAGAEELAFLEKLTHPRIRRRLQDEIEKLKQEGKVRVAVLDAPVLMKTDWGRFCDKLLFIDAPQSMRLERAASRNWVADELLRREAAQVPVGEKRGKADVIIENSGSTERFREQIQDFWDSL